MGNGRTPAPTPIEGVPFPMPTGGVTESRRYRRRKTDKPIYRAATLVAKALPILALLGGAAWGLAQKYVVTRDVWDQEMLKRAAFEARVETRLDAIQKAIEGRH